MKVTGNLPHVRPLPGQSCIIMTSLFTLVL